MPKRTKPITDEILDYIERTFCAEEPFPRPAAARTEVHISAIEGKFLQIILQIAGAINVIEVGTMHGYSTAWLASSLAENGKLISIEKNRENYEQACANLSALPNWKNIQLVNEDALVYLETLPSASFDAMFIDANKAAYPVYLQEAGRLLKPGGVLLADDSLLFAEVWLNCNHCELSYMELGIKKFNDDLSKSKFFKGMVLPILHGITIAFRTDVESP